MDTEAIRDRSITIFRRVFEDETLEVKDSTTADDVHNWDSLNHVILITEVEKEFGIKFALGELQDLKNVGDLWRAIATKV